MGKYGQVANIAADFLIKSDYADPRKAWSVAVMRVFPGKLSSQAKSCPRDSFLGLCDMGEIENIPAGNYTRSVKNKDYISRALMAIRSNPELVDDENRLWIIATDGVKKAPNQQMDVLISLWRNGKIK